MIQLLNLRCNHDKHKHPHGMIQGNYKGKMVSKMAQEWPTIMCRKICTGIEKAIQAQGQENRLHLSKPSQPQQVVPQDHEKESNVQLVFKTDPEQITITHALKDNAIALSKT